MGKGEGFKAGKSAQRGFVLLSILRQETATVMLTGENMKYYVIVKGAGKQAQFTVEPCTEKMTEIDVRDAVKVIVEDMAKALVKEGMQPVIEVSEATRRMGK